MKGTPPGFDEVKAAIAPRVYYAGRFTDVRLVAGASGWSKNFQCPFPEHDDTTASFGVNLETGAFKCHGCGVAGSSIIDFEMRDHGLSDRQARDKLAADYGIVAGTSGGAIQPPKPPQRAQRVTAISPRPIPAMALATKPQAHPTLGKPGAEWVYRDARGKALLLIWRFDPPGGRKLFQPLSFVAGANGGEWRFKGLAAGVATPLFHLDEIAARPQAAVVVGEGEKSAEALALLLPECVATTSLNGAAGPKKADWTPVAGRVVYLWPDADPPGGRYAREVAELVFAAGASRVRMLDLDSLRHDPLTGESRELAKGWDAADALAAGWTAERLATRARWVDWSPQSPLGSESEADATVGVTSGISAPPGLPAGYDWRATGIFFRYPAEPPDKARFVCPPLTVLAISHDDQGKDFGRLVAFADLNGVSQRMIVYDYERSGSGDALRTRFARRGFECATTAEGRRLFSDLLRRWCPAARALSVRKTGWTRDQQCFVLGHHTIGPPDGVPVILADEVERPATARSGSLADCQQQVLKFAEGNSRLMLGLSAGFAPPLIALLGTESGGLNYFGDTSLGKTTLVNVVASLWGQPNEYRRQWRATSNGLEGAALAHNDLPLILDDLGQLAPREAGDSAYLLANGQNKQRLTPGAESRPTHTWRLIFISTGELTLAELAAQGGTKLKAGQEVRVLEVPADAGQGLGIYETLHGQRSGAALSAYLNGAASRCYGSAGPAFVERLVAERREIAAWVKERLRDCADQLLGGITDPPGEVTRAAQRFALVALAGTLASHWQIAPWPVHAALDATKTCFAAWLAARGGAVSATERDLLDQVRGFLKRHANRFRWHHRSRDDHAPEVPNAAGYRVKLDPATRATLVVDGDETRYSPQDYIVEFRVFPQIFREEVIGGFDYRTAVLVLRRHGLIKVGADGKVSRKLRVPGFEHPQRFVVMDLVDHPLDEVGEEVGR